MRMLTLADGLLAGGGETLKYVCGECNFQGMPLLFARDPDYAEFRESLRGPPGQERSAAEAAALSDASAEATMEAARRRPEPQVQAHPGLLDQLRVMPVLALVVGGLIFLVGLSTLVRIVTSAVPFGLYGLFWAVLWMGLGLAGMLVGRRAWARPAS